MKLILGSCLLFLTTFSSCQIPWSKASEWTLYEYQGNKLFVIPIDSLKTMYTQTLSQDSMSDFLSSAEILHPKASIIWMGGYIVTCKLDGVVRKIELSNYGGFFYDEKTKVYYQIDADKKDSWGSYIQQCFLALSRKEASKYSIPNPN